MTKKAKQPRSKKRRKPNLESLQPRELMASVQLAHGTLFIEGSNASDQAQVNYAGGYVKTSLNGRVSYEPTSQVKRIQFRGHNGNDYFRNDTNVNSLAIGGAGNDTLVGGNGSDRLFGESGRDRLYGRNGNDVLSGSDGQDYLDGGSHNDQLYGGSHRDVIFGSFGNDIIYGGSGNDDLVGGSGNDRLYGGSGNDRLWGQSGNDYIAGGDHSDKLYGGSGSDGLHGGSGPDLIYGGSDADRFLWPSGDSVQDYRSHDVRINFVNGSSRWTAKEIEVVDEAFAQVQARTGSTRLLKDSNRAASSLTFQKANSHQRWSGLNSQTSGGRHWIQIRDWNENDSRWNEAMKDTVLHELGHNWDTENPYWNSFLRLSGWTETPRGNAYNHAITSSVTGRFSGWYYLKTKVDHFDRDYARTSPYEDFADAFEAYITGHSSSRIAQKVALINYWALRV